MIQYDLADIPSDALATILAASNGSNEVFIDDDPVPVAAVRDEILARYRAIPSSNAADIIGLRLNFRAGQPFSIAERQAMARVALGAMVAEATFRQTAHPCASVSMQEVVAELPRVNFHAQTRSRPEAVALRMSIDVYVARQILGPEKVKPEASMMGNYPHFENVLKKMSSSMTDTTSQAIFRQVLDSFNAATSFVEPRLEILAMSAAPRADMKLVNAD